MQQQPSCAFALADAPSARLQVNARVLQPPQLFYKDRRGQPLPMRVNNGAWNLRDVCLHKGAKLNAFAICSFDNPRVVDTGGQDSVLVSPCETAAGTALDHVLPSEQSDASPAWLDWGLRYAGSLIAHARPCPVQAAQGLPNSA